MVGMKDAALLGLRAYEIKTIAEAAFGTWACPEYLAPMIGFAFECKVQQAATKRVAENARKLF